MSREVIHLSDHFTYKKILKFTLAPILMMLFTSIYWIVDGFFISNYVGTSAFAGVNLIFPIIMCVACLGFMFGSGCAALVSKRLGEQDQEGANRTFSLITYVTFAVGLIVSIAFFFLVKPIARGFAEINSMNTTEEMIDNAATYGRIMIAGVSIYIMQLYFHPFFSVNEKSVYGFLFTLASGLINMFLDFLLGGLKEPPSEFDMLAFWKRLTKDGSFNEKEMMVSGLIRDLAYLLMYKFKAHSIFGK